MKAPNVISTNTTKTTTKALSNVNKGDNINDPNVGVSVCEENNALSLKQQQVCV